MVDQRNILQSMNAHETVNHFRPVKCLEKDIKERDSVKGFVYFAMDTHKIYCGIDNGEYELMGGSSGVYYGNRILTDDEKYGDQVFFNFAPTDIDGTDLPSIDSLILNIPDGGFYRVLNVEPANISTQRLVIAGGGGGTSSGPSNEGSLQINYITPRDTSTITGVEYWIEFEIVAKDSAGDLIGDAGIATWKINGKEYTQKVYNGYNRFRVDEYLDHTIEKNSIILVVSMNTGGVNNSIVSKTWSVIAINLELEWNLVYSQEEYRTGDTFSLSFTPYGNIDCEAHIIFDNNYELGVSYFIESIPANKTGKLYITNPMPSLEYGSHTCQIYLTAVVNEEPQTTPTIQHEITFIKDGTSTILTVPYYQTSANQYDTLNIPFLVYDPDTEKCNVSFYVNDTYISGDSYDRGLQSWPYTVTEYGTVKLSIRTNNGDAYKDIELVVNKLDLDVSEVEGAVFNLKASAFSSNEEIRNWTSGTDNVTLSFSDNFDWKNGGLKFETMDDGSIEKYIVVRQGTRMYINYPLFGKFTSGSTGGKDFKICFKTANVYDYEAPVLTCYDANSKMGIRFDAQKAMFETPANQGFATQYYENSYLEIETEIWPNVPDPDTSKKLYGDRFIMMWVDGVPAGVKPYSTNESLSQTNPQIIEIGSDLCDVHVYVAKAYERRLTEDEHLNNFIMDAPSTNKMLDRYRRNNILDNRGEISYEKLVANNPDCHAYLYEVPYVTTEKDDKVDDCTYHELWREYNTLEKPYYRGEKVRTYVQGTSSAAYGVAAFNLRSDFKKKGTLYDKDGNDVEGWKVTETAIPVEIACTKVNVASCENVNNVVNQEWYHRYQPYHDAHRRKSSIDGKAYRDTMEFNTGVVFIKDNNPTITYYDNEGKPDRDGYLNANTFLDTNKYTDAPYYKQYAIGNMGNDKKNTNVFHDKTNPWALCVEVADNQNPEHWMTVPVNMSQFDLEKPFHEFRYPDGNDEATTTQKQAWLDFVNWMSSCDPSPYNATEHPNGYVAEKILKATAVELTADTYKPNIYFIIDNDGYYRKAEDSFNVNTTYYSIAPGTQTENDVLINVVFDNYTFKGFDPPGFEGTESPTGISLKGTTVKQYSTTKVVEQKKLDSNGDPILDDDGNFVMETIQTIVPYTHDTYEYRMAKMLSECEDHLVMDSVVYHYLFIQRHTMVDNVAKNTFWSTEDGIHWDLTKDYDNDTADGNNNSGYLVFTYGIECMDKASDNSDIFNASPSVWFNFIYGLPEAQKQLHKDLEGYLVNGAGAWNAKAYLAECKRHQEVIPERCWIYDYIRKYIRPRRLGLDSNTYLERLEGGKKTHQRTQYETYQEFYLNSKYVAGSAFSQGTAADLRLNKDPNGIWDVNNILPMSFYIDCYSTIYLGGQLKTSERLKRGQVWNAPVGTMIGSPNDATCYIFGPNMLQTISGLHKLYPFYATLNTAGKLREVAFGSSEEGYYNARLKAPDIGSNAMLQKVQMQNSGIPTGLGALILNQAFQLKELYLSGSTTSELELADGSTIEILELNPLTTLSLSNLTDLETVTMDSDIYNTITNLYITNCPKLDSYTYQFVKQPQINRYQLNEVNWIIEATDDSYQLTDDFVLTDGEVSGIIALDNLNDTNTAPKEGTTTATALTGTLTINVPCTIDEYTIYKKYIKTYPNLIIAYGNKVGEGRDPAVELLFLANKDSEEQYYRVLGSGDADGDSIAKLISAQGPLGIAMGVPNKESTVSQNFTFTGYWIHEKTIEGVTTSTKYYVPGYFAEGAVIEDGAISFESIIPTENMTFYPEYIVSTRQYNVKFYDYDGSVVLQDGKEQWPVNYNTIYDGPIENFNYRDSSSLTNSKMRWAFQGWSKYKYSDGAVRDPKYEDLSTLVVTGDVILYAHYLQEDCTLVPSKQEYFNFDVSTSTISIKSNYRGILAGKITLPSVYEVNGTAYPINTVGDFQHLQAVTHIFFLSDNTSYTAIADYAFRNRDILIDGYSKTYSIKGIYLPENIKTIGSYAFTNLSSITEFSWGNLITKIGQMAFSGCSAPISQLPANIDTLGMGAFLSANNVAITELPNSLRVIDNYAFQLCNQTIISVFGGPESRLTTIGKQAFENCGLGMTAISVATIGSSVVTIGLNAFLGYNLSNGASVQFAKESASAYILEGETTHGSVDTMGLDPTKVSITWNYTGEGGI